MKTRRRLAAGAAGLAVALLAVPLTPSGARSGPTRTDRAGRDVTARHQSEAALTEVTAPPSTTTSTAPPPPTVVCPVAGPVAFIDSFGFRRSGHRHQGVDMLAAEGTPVVAPVAGLVEQRGNRTGGLSYHLHGLDGTYYYGTHLSAYGAGGWVQPGDVIGYVGDTGNARGTPHLHFEIHPGGEGTAAIDPYDFVSFLCPNGAAAA